MAGMLAAEHRRVLVEILRLIAALEHEDAGHAASATQAAELVMQGRDKEAVAMLRGSPSNALVAAGILLESHLTSELN